MKMIQRNLLELAITKIKKIVPTYMKMSARGSYVQGNSNTNRIKKKKPRHIHKGDGKPFQNEIKLP